jgi:hypothetical protein
MTDFDYGLAGGRTAWPVASPAEMFWPDILSPVSHLEGTESSQTRRWRETDSNPRSPVEESPFVETVLSRFLPPLRFRGGQSVLTNCLQGRGDRSIAATHATRGRHVEGPVKSAYVREVQGPG